MGYLQGDGIIRVNTLNLNSAAIDYFAGYITADTINSTVTTLTYAVLEPKHIFNVTAGVITFKGGDGLKIAKDVTIIMNGGSISTEDSTRIRGAINYSVIYKKTTTTTGTEITGSGLQHVTIDIDSTKSLTLTSDLTVGGTLSLLSGNLILGGKDVTVNGSVAEVGNGFITSDSTSSITVNSPNGSKGALVFSNSGASAKNLTINVGAGNQALLRGSLSIFGRLELKTGILNFWNSSLTIRDSITGTGYLSSNSSSNLSLITKGISSNPLNFASGGQILRDVSLSVGNGNYVALSSPLTITGMLTIDTGSSFNLNSKLLTLDDNSSVEGKGTFAVNPASDLVINSVKGISSLAIIGTLGNLTINTQASGSAVTLGKDLIVGNVLFLKSGELVLNKKNLTIYGNISTSTDASISSDSNSTITIALSVAPTTPLKFTPSANTVKSFSIFISNGEMLPVGSELTIHDTLNLKKGMLNIGNNLLHIGERGVILGITNSSYINTAEGGAVEMYVPTGLINTVVFPVGTAAHFLPAKITINSGSEGRNIQVGAVKGVFSQGTTGADISAQKSVVDATWNIASKNKDNLNMNLQVLWTKAMEVNGFNINTAYISHFSANRWDSVTIQDAAVKESDSTYSLIRKGITSLSPFAVFDKTTTDVLESSPNTKIEIEHSSSSDYITIRTIPTIHEPMNLNIYNVMGQLMGSYNVDNTTQTVSIKELIHGLYFITLSNSTMNAHMSFINI